MPGLLANRPDLTLSGKKLEAVTHETLDQVQLAQHNLIAQKLRENPDTILALAQRNLERYIANRPTPATFLWRQWRTLLEENSIDHIVAVMTAKTQKATELRQASPFAGALTHDEIATTIQREKERARARTPGYGSLDPALATKLFKRSTTCPESHCRTLSRR